MGAVRRKWIRKSFNERFLELQFVAFMRLNGNSVDRLHLKGNGKMCFKQLLP